PLGGGTNIGPLEPPLVIQPGPAPDPATPPEAYARSLREGQTALKEARIEGLLLKVEEALLPVLPGLRKAIGDAVAFLVWQLDNPDEATLGAARQATRPGDLWLVSFSGRGNWITFCGQATAAGARPVLAISPENLTRLFPGDLEEGGLPAILTLPDSALSPGGIHPLGRYRQLAEVLDHLGSHNPVWIRNTPRACIDPAQPAFGDRLLEASILSGALLCDGIGDLLSVESVPSIRQSTTLAYNILQGARARTTKTEYVACPSCGRTLFDLQSTTQRIREATGHLKGVTIAVMGCIVNGPGEMADADFGYVGGAPGKVNLYVGRECVQYHIPAANAVTALIDLIREHGKWTDPPADA
ncbi:MAG TPA: flavodoxin-dependent (E)-4-hydroxy-3-methylbut-2-enyl-diphosphate synthase, partial [Oceanipulchritudo sp.]|nr:flavodoxin-dependent (E)-4-hydroxy-3-methylbut-2-enyl-diphosphate synthase [Oceanipulchritudo sp.]